MAARIVEVRISPEHTWYVASALFATPYMARQAWELVERKLPTGSLGIYRHGPEQRRGRMVTVVSTERAQVLRGARLLRLGEDCPLDEATMRALIARRARVVLAAAGEGQASGRLKWRRPEERGARLTPEGDLREPGGQG